MATSFARAPSPRLQQLIMNQYYYQPGRGTSPPPPPVPPPPARSSPPPPARPPPPFAASPSPPGRPIPPPHHLPRDHYLWQRYFDALLADLQSTVSPGSGVGGYGSLNGRTRDVSNAPRPVFERLDGSLSPTYQNQRLVQETITTTTTSASAASPGAPRTAPHKGSAALSSNLSELDSLLQDLSSARYSTAERRSHEVVLANGSAVGHSRPSVDSLLDELSAPSHGEMISPPRTPASTITRTHAVDYSSSYGMSGGSGSPASGPGSGASTATKELDLLMASLADFKITASSHQHQTVSDSPYAKPNKATKSGSSPAPPVLRSSAAPAPSNTSASAAAAAAKQNQLDSMLGNLQADMSRQGVNTTQKGCCNACDKPIVGQVITALGKTWHPEHFTCNHCNQELGTRNFFERDGHPYCEPDYHNLFSPRCAYCNGPILDKCVTALEKTWHTEHFFCAQCGKQFGEEGFHERDGKPYCRDDYFDMFAPKCGACNRAIMENYISALNSQWHADCFVCRDCKNPVQGKSFYAMEGKPVCPKCVGVDDEDED